MTAVLMIFFTEHDENGMSYQSEVMQISGTTPTEKKIADLSEETVRELIDRIDKRARQERETK